MKFASLAVALISVLSLTGPVLAKAPVSCHASSNGEIERLFATFNAAWATKDPDKVAVLFTRDAVLLPTVSNQARTTSEGVRDYFVSFLKKSPSARIDTGTIRLDCNTASRAGTWTVTLKDDSGTSQDIKARYTFIYRFDRGTWKIDHLHSSVMPETTDPK
ncbi:SgcJ/EcaC family oxidoreductase [Bradyrhizobium sp. KB893862 SZCCT0404]|uniref:SgcJ/EcaC family oxidoreductase n=1 Tax=Bradyrhizobium sp. KB893862 SZCCT0404 TaxID=2807672 RepID=UPI001BA9F979|nr:SgcJ/EcaC family oxidoreductase [Bradyrhizobium sp. KB893862 SZCCT0404]MBR1177184.1 SgcJ/EcaC family oxidoreductase [Bradyrhizobium sp. KB893862 SZCCT0404]